MTKKEMALRLYEQGFKGKEIAEKLGVSIATVRRWGAKRNHEDIRDERRKKVALAAELCEQGLTMTAIADRLGIGYSTVAQYLRDAGIKYGKPAKKQVCRYSPDCFTCPMADCKLSGGNMATINALETDKDMRAFLS